MRRVLAALSIMLALAGLTLAGIFLLDSYRVRGDIALRPGEAPGMKFAVNESLVHGIKVEATRWSSDYTDEILGVTGGQPAAVRRAYVSCEAGVEGLPNPSPLKDVVLLDASGARLETDKSPFQKAPLAWPDPFYALLPDKRVHHFSEWSPSPAAANAVASFLARAPVVKAEAVCKLEPDLLRDGVPHWRIRVGLKASLEDGRALSAWGDLFITRQTSLLLDQDWRGSLDGPSGEVHVEFTRRRRPLP